MNNLPLRKVRMLEPDHPTKATGVFRGEASGFLNWNDILYERFNDIDELLINNFWKPSSVNMTQDKKGFQSLSPEVQDVFLEILTMLSGLDSLQTPTILEILSFVVDPAVKSNLANIAQQESIHNRSYSYVNSALIPLERQKQLYEKMQKHEHVLKRNKLVLDAYEDFKENKTPETLLRALVQSTNLEGIFFYAAFAFYYNLARQQKMVQTSTLISYIHRDEMVHYEFIIMLIQILMHEYPELNNEENTQYIYDAIREAVELEKEWAENMLGHLEEELDFDLDEMQDYIEYIANKRLRMMGLDNLYKEYKTNPMPWIKTFDDDSINKTKSDFFEVKPRDYGHVNEKNGFDDL